jgi:hypothetical protein
MCVIVNCACSSKMAQALCEMKRQGYDLFFVHLMLEGTVVLFVCVCVCVCVCVLCMIDCTHTHTHTNTGSSLI